MKVTTVRFGADLWRLLAAEAELAGVSISQYIREAALARAAAAAARRGEDPVALLGQAAQPPAPPPDERDERRIAAAMRRQAAELRSERKATSAEAEQVIRRSRQIRSQSEDLTRPRRHAAS